MTSQRWWKARPFEVLYSPTAKTGASRDVMIGVGHALDELTDDYVVLNVKAGPLRTGSVEFRCCAALVAQATDESVARWKRCFPNGIGGVQRFVVEDSSLDTCMALLLFARAIDPDPGTHVTQLGAVQAHAGDSLRLTSWLAYVEDWELGIYRDGVDKRESAACMLAVLAHHLFVGNVTDGPALSSSRVRDALVASLTMLDGYIEENATARNAVPPDLPEFLLADSQLRFENQQYQLALKYGLQTQLSVPLAASSRCVLVDALIVSDVALTGILKVWARTDVEASWTKRGFAVLGIYRPDLKGTGSDITFSVDPRTGLTLELLWDRLEDLENRKWGDARPREKPRVGIVKYSDPVSGAPLAGSPNEPWYDERGRYTLIGAPKAVAGNSSGTRLDWTTDVLPTLWDLYRPFPGKLAVDESMIFNGKRIAVVTWPSNDHRGIARTPALHRWLATCSSSHSSHRLDEFVLLADVEIVALTGGEVLVHPEGITLFDDWTPTPLDITRLKSIAKEMASLAEDYAELLTDGSLKRLLTMESHTLSRIGRLGFRRVAEQRKRIIDLKARVVSVGTRERSLPLGHGMDALLTAVESAWAFPKVRHELANSMKELDASLSEALALQVERRQYVSNIIVSVAGLFFLLRDGIGVIQAWLTMNVYDLQLAVARVIKVDHEALAKMETSASRAEVADTALFFIMLLVLISGIASALISYFGWRPPSFLRRRKKHPPSP